jgi:hypothetical protein
MAGMEGARWTLDELAERVDAALAVDYHGQRSGRVRDVPDRRAIRWYTTIGLVDRPVAHRGRTALYGPRHLLQLVAVKRLQANGLPLVAIQQELAGATDTELGRVARVPATTAAPRAAHARAPVRKVATGPPAPGAETDPPAGEMASAGQTPGAAASAASEVSGAAAVRRLAAGPARRAAFWRDPPVAARTTEAAGALGPEASILPAVGSLPPRSAGVATLRGLRLADGATLLLEPGRDLDTEDLRAIHDAAQPLIAVLRARQLGGPPAPPGAGGEPRREHP